MHSSRLSTLALIATLAATLGGAFGGDVAKAAPTDQDAMPEPVAWWKLDEDTGGKAVDSSGQGHDGVLSDDATFETCSAPGRDGNALKVDGNIRLTIPEYKGIEGTAQRTVTAWVKTTEGEGEVISWGGSEFGTVWSFCFIRGGLGITPNGGYLYMNARIQDDQWHHVAAAIEPSELPNLHDDVCLYLDGKPAEIDDIGLLDLWPLETGNERDVILGIGFTGLIDDARIYDRALTVDEIQALFDSY